MTSHIVIEPICLDCMSFNSDGKNCCYYLTSLDGAQKQRHILKKLGHVCIEKTRDFFLLPFFQISPFDWLLHHYSLFSQCHFKACGDTQEDIEVVLLHIALKNVLVDCMLCTLC